MWSECELYKDVINALGCSRAYCSMGNMDELNCGTDLDEYPGQQKQGQTQRRGIRQVTIFVYFNSFNCGFHGCTEDLRSRPGELRNGAPHVQFSA